MSLDSAPTSRPSIAHITVEQVKQRLDNNENLVLVDIREPYELLYCHLDDTINIPMSTLATRWHEIPTDRPVVIFCHAGVRSVNVILQLQTVGFTNLLNMVGGIDAWSVGVDPSVPRY